MPPRIVGVRSNEHIGCSVQMGYGGTKAEYNGLVIDWAIHEILRVNRCAPKINAIQLSIMRCNASVAIWRRREKCSQQI
jgi:hypothetical protein